MAVRNDSSVELLVRQRAAHGREPVHPPLEHPPSNTHTYVHLSHHLTAPRCPLTVPSPHPASPRLTGPIAIRLLQVVLPPGASLPWAWHEPLAEPSLFVLPMSATEGERHGDRSTAAGAANAARAVAERALAEAHGGGGEEGSRAGGAAAKGGGGRSGPKDGTAERRAKTRAAFSARAGMSSAAYRRRNSLDSSAKGSEYSFSSVGPLPPLKLDPTAQVFMPPPPPPPHPLLSLSPSPPTSTLFSLPSLL